MAIKYIIPVRRNSKGFPFKNRKLISYTLSIIPDEFRSDIIISTDDEEIIRIYKDDYNIHRRDTAYACDTSSIKSVIQNVASDIKFNEHDIIVMLYVTYPSRKWEDIESVINIIQNGENNSLLCRKEPKTHPYMCLQATVNGHGHQLKYHDMYRRQDYPECFEICHYISAFRYSELSLLNSQLYNSGTFFMKIEDVIDVDYEEDFENFKKAR